MFSYEIGMVYQHLCLCPCFLHYLSLFLFLQLHHVGAPVSAAVAPVTYMWRSFHNANGYNEPQEIEGSSFFRQLWVWIHAAAFSEGVDALKLACQRQVKYTGHFSFNTGLLFYLVGL